MLYQTQINKFQVWIPTWGGVLAFKNEEILPSEEFVALISRLAELKTAELSRDLSDQEVTEISKAELKLWNNISLEDLEMFILEIQILQQKQQNLDNSSPAKFIRFIDNQVDNSSTVKFGKNIWQKVDKHLNGNTVGNKLADSIQADKNKYQKEGKKSDEIRAKFMEEFENSRIKNANKRERPNQNKEKINILFALLTGALLTGAGLTLNGDIKGVKGLPELLSEKIPTPTLIDAIKEVEQNKQFLSPNIELESPKFIDTVSNIQQEIMQSDLYMTKSQLEMAQSYFQNYSTIDKNDKELFMREIIAYQAKMENLTKKLQSPNNTQKIDQLSEELLEMSKQIDHLQKTFENNESRTELKSGTFGEYAKKIPQTRQEGINLRQKFNNKLNELRTTLQSLKDKRVIMKGETQSEIVQNINKIISLARYNDQEGIDQANKKLSELIKQLQQTQYKIHKSN